MSTNDILRELSQFLPQEVNEEMFSGDDAREATEDFVPAALFALVDSQELVELKELVRSMAKVIGEGEEADFEHRWSQVMAEIGKPPGDVGSPQIKGQPTQGTATEKTRSETKPSREATTAPPRERFQRDAGRPVRYRGKLDDVIKEQICGLIHAGHSLRSAARHLALPESTIRSTVERDADFSERLQKVRANRELSHLETIHAAAGKYWRASAWILERLNPRVYSKKKCPQINLGLSRQLGQIKVQTRPSKRPAGRPP